MELAPNIYLNKILEYDDLFFGEEIDIETTLCKYSRELIVDLVNCLALTYENAYIPDANNPYFSYSTPKVRDLDSKLSSFLCRTHRKNICYCTSRSILELMRYTFSIPHDKYLRSNDLIDFEYDLFKVILKINQQLMHFSSQPGDEDVVTLTFLLNYISNDVINTNWKTTFQTQIYYINSLLSFLQSHSVGKMLLERFCQQLKIPSVKEYEQTIWAIIVLYTNQKKEKSRSCPRLDLNSISDHSGFLHKEVCEYLSLGVNKYVPYSNVADIARDGNVDYREFRSHPLVKIDDQKYIIYNLPLLIERLYNSLFFDLKPFYKGNFFNYYNKEFVERWLFHRTMLLCLGKKVSAYYPLREDIESADPIEEFSNAPDFYIRENDSIILFECKGIKINGSIKDTADVDEFIRVLKNKLFLSTENLDTKRKQKSKTEFVGISQLVNSIDLIEDDVFEPDKHIPLEVSYYPVIVFEDSKLAQMGMMGLLNKWYHQYLVERGLVEQVCNPIIPISISTLYLFSDKFKIFGFQKIFDEFLSKNLTMGENGSKVLSPFSDFDNYMYQRYQISTQIRREYQIYTKKICN